MAKKITIDREEALEALSDGYIVKDVVTGYFFHYNQETKVTDYFDDDNLTFNFEGHEPSLPEYKNANKYTIITKEEFEKYMAKRLNELKTMLQENYEDSLAYLDGAIISEEN